MFAAKAGGITFQSTLDSYSYRVSLCAQCLLSSTSSKQIDKHPEADHEAGDQGHQCQEAEEIVQDRVLVSNQGQQEPVCRPHWGNDEGVYDRAEEKEENAAK